MTFHVWQCLLLFSPINLISVIYIQYIMLLYVYYIMLTCNKNEELTISVEPWWLLSANTYWGDKYPLLRIFQFSLTFIYPAWLAHWVHLIITLHVSPSVISVDYYFISHMRIQQADMETLIISLSFLGFVALQCLIFINMRMNLSNS